ncbi:MAG: DivIVA domain-containing protein [Bifidobacterium sp.]|jgi:DivIVA domain-containing protein|nr:DivIVA domain-containing protein [Bifidobacterium sp.]MCH4174734.1 DivIVA domain-containing protein [Bifidobacterium sp.]
MVLLTPKDIRERYIPVVRFKEGFDKDAVDDFLDEVAETVEVLGRQAMQNDASTQSLGPDVAKLNSKISELTAQVESLQKENATLKSAPNKSDGPAEGTAKLAEAEQRVQTLATQNEQLKQQVDQLNNQIDQLTAQAAKGNDAEALANQLTAVQQERDSFRSRGEGLQQQLSAAQQQVVQLQQQLSQQSGASQNLSKQLDESKQREEQLRQQVSKMEPSTETGSLKKIAGAGADANSEPERATAMLTLAMQLHDQYVDKGKAKGAELIADGQSKHDASVAKADEYSNRTHVAADEYAKRTHTDADNYSAQVHSEADAYSTKTRSDADIYSKHTRAEADTYESEVQKRAQQYDKETRTGADQYAAGVKDKLVTQSKVIEGNIQGLKQFESEYRSRLTEFLGQLVSQVSDTNSYQAAEGSNDSKH